MKSVVKIIGFTFMGMAVGGAITYVLLPKRSKDELMKKVAYREKKN